MDSTSQLLMQPAPPARPRRVGPDLDSSTAARDLQSLRSARATGRPSAAISPSGMVQLQRSAGNAAVAGLLASKSTASRTTVQRCGTIPPNQCPCHDNDDNSSEAEDTSTEASAPTAQRDGVESSSSAAAPAAPQSFGPAGNRPACGADRERTLAGVKPPVDDAIASLGPAARTVISVPATKQPVAHTLQRTRIPVAQRDGGGPAAYHPEGGVVASIQLCKDLMNGDSSSAQDALSDETQLRSERARHHDKQPAVAQTLLKAAPGSAAVAGLLSRGGGFGPVAPPLAVQRDDDDEEEEEEEESGGVLDYLEKKGEAVVDAVSGAASSTAEVVSGAASSTGDAVSSAASSAYDAVSGTASSAYEAVSGAASSTADAVSGAASALGDAVSDEVQAAKQTLGAYLEGKTAEAVALIARLQSQLGTLATMIIPADKLAELNSHIASVNSLGKGLVSLPSIGGAAGGEADESSASPGAVSGLLVSLLSAMQGLSSSPSSAKSPPVQRLASEAAMIAFEQAEAAGMIAIEVEAIPAVVLAPETLGISIPVALGIAAAIAVAAGLIGYAVYRYTHPEKRPWGPDDEITYSQLQQLEPTMARRSGVDYSVKPANILADPAKSAQWDECVALHEKYEPTEEGAKGTKQQFAGAAAEINKITTKIAAGTATSDDYNKFCELLRARIKLAEQLATERFDYVAHGCDNLPWPVPPGETPRTPDERRRGHVVAFEEALRAMKKLLVKLAESWC